MTRRTAKNPLLARGNVVKETGRKMLETSNGPNHSDTDKERRTMAVDSQYSDSACAGNPPKCDTRKSLGALAAELARKAGVK